FLNIGATGMLSAEVGELEELRFIDRTKALQSIEANRGLIRGVKVRLSRQQVGPNARVALLTARETAEAARLPLMVHVGDTPIPLDDILIELRAGDVLTHCFHGRPQGVLDEHGRVRAEARRAADRGVTFDVGHGVGSFSFAVARPALASSPCASSGMASRGPPGSSSRGSRRRLDNGTVSTEILLAHYPFAEVRHEPGTLPAQLRRVRRAPRVREQRRPRPDAQARG